MVNDRRELQAAFDAAALAGAIDLPDTLTAAQTAKQYLRANGVDSDADVSIYFSADNRQITIEGSRDVDYIFANVFANGNSGKVGTLATAETGSGGFFADNDCALLSLSTTVPMVFSQINMNLTDPIHSNNQIIIANDSNGVYDHVSACKGVVTPQWYGGRIGETTNDAALKVLPSVNDMVDQAVRPSDSEFASFGITKSGGTYYLGGYDNNGLHCYDNLIARYGDTPIYFNGNVVLTNGNFNSTGTIIAEGDFTLQNTNTSMNSSNATCFVSVNGDVNIQNCQADLRGVIYAPNGKVSLNAFSAKVTGAVIADTISIVNGSPTISFDAEAGAHVPGGSGHPKLVK